MNDPIPAGEPVNPYAPPKASIAPAGATAPEDAERIRRELLTHETSIRGVGLLYLLGTVTPGLATVTMLFMAVAEPSVESSPVFLGFGVVYGLVAWLFYYLGRGLRRLNPRVRTGATILAVLGLLLIPIGTLINGYVLYLLHSQKGKRVMTPEYQAIVAQTPHIKYRTPVWLIVLGLLLVALIIAGVLSMFSS